MTNNTMTEETTKYDNPKRDIVKRLNEIAWLIHQLKHEREQLIKQCPHEFKPLTKSQEKDKWMSEYACCTICGECFGWRCKESPDQVCHYYTDGNEENPMIELVNGTAVPAPNDHWVEYETDDCCIFCGHPEERK